MPRPSQVSPEVRERAVRMVQEPTPAHGSQWAAVRSVAEKLGCLPDTLLSWLSRHEGHTGYAAPVRGETGRAAGERIGAMGTPTVLANEWMLSVIPTLVEMDSIAAGLAPRSTHKQP